MNYEFLIILVPVILFSLTIHEYAHALVAYRLGDDTAKRQGRLSLNPLVHLDVLGTLLLFIVHFGWAKPVPVDPRNFRNPKKDMLMVAIAGPISNILTAIAAAVILKALFENFAAIPPGSGADVAARMLVWFMYIGIVLAVFNMIPVPPLDGSRVLYGLLPDSLAYRYARFETYGIFILFAFFLFGGQFLGYFIRVPVVIFIQMCNFSPSELEIVIRAMNP
ncbi:MAG: site-2 protease family protein [Candidatus Dadabacteria bacterium]|nr:site-2 protease family protein [Candidatus Dadabacteria bacterium]MDE0158806.1 site-2 protease family protein [Candidatus Dadabacteria bacterium]MDE0291366.1 site-2 protease family protein [Candidatus Dadabacteria bacterium]MDE0477399.1 site-2 protease family protein [Candidatus Dadabacteria bacterium]MXZ48275.1 site-2 protease family protein [Candidatus Dadabacteria bacterium]